MEGVSRVVDVYERVAAPTYPTLGGSAAAGNRATPQLDNQCPCWLKASLLQPRYGRPPLGQPCNRKDAFLSRPSGRLINKEWKLQHGRTSLHI